MIDNKTSFLFLWELPAESETSERSDKEIQMFAWFAMQCLVSNLNLAINEICCDYIKMQNNFNFKKDRGKEFSVKNQKYCNRMNFTVLYVFKSIKNISSECAKAKKLIQ